MTNMDDFILKSFPLLSAPSNGQLQAGEQTGTRYLVARDGLWREVVLPWVTALHRIAISSVPLPYGALRAEVILHVSVVPKDLLQAFWNAAREALPNEMAAALVWNEQTDRWRFEVRTPLHASPGLVHYKEIALAQHEHMVVDLHSHGTIPAFFSAQDDADDAGSMKISGVIGSLHAKEPTYQFRMNMNRLITEHYLNPRLLTRPVNVVLVGAGGTGSRLLERLLVLHGAMLALGHPYGLQVAVVDPDVVSPSNVGRQCFYACDVGAHKAHVLVNRANMVLQDRQWVSVVAKVGDLDNIRDCDLVIGCVDNREARRTILRMLSATDRNHYRHGRGDRYYWLDCGNRRDDGQVILGEIYNKFSQLDSTNRLPHVADLYPEVIDTKIPEDDTPSCSLAEALERQSLFINPMLADFAGNILWRMFTTGKIQAHGAFVNLATMSASPLPIDPQVWARMGYTPPGPKKPARKRKQKN